MSIALAAAGPTTNGATSAADNDDDEQGEVGAGSNNEAESQAGEGSEDEEEEDSDDEDDPEAIARRLGDQLWADINRAHADRVKATEQPAEAAPTVAPPQPTQKEIAAITTMKTVLSFAATDPFVQSTLSTTFVPGLAGASVLDLLKQAVESGNVTREVAAPLSQVVVSLAKSEILFSPLPAPITAAHEQSIGKRKRPGEDEGGDAVEGRSGKRLSQDNSNPHQFLADDLSQAVNVISDVLKPALTATGAPPAPNPELIKSIQPQLHQVFLFAATSSTVIMPHDPSGASTAALREIGALIQVLAVRSGIEISANNGHVANGVDGHVVSNDGQANINTAVYPCQATPTCHKIFSRLYLLRQHQRSHSAGSTQHRPFKCPHPDCPASFARNHDLKRHVKTHGKRAFRCSGCGKTFSRRDAVDRHKRGNVKEGRGKSLTVAPACADAETVEVDMDDSDLQGFRFAFKETNRRPRSWEDVSHTIEEGEFDLSELARTQEMVRSLYPILQAYASTHVPPHPSAVEVPSTSEEDQATLASVLLRFLTSADGDIGGNPSIGGADDSSAPNAQVQQAPGSETFPVVEDSAQTDAPALSLYGLDPNQSKLLEEAIANATAAAQAQAEAEALLEEEEDSEGDETDDSEMDVDGGADSSMNSNAS